ncbi:MAG TPA: MFS transporter [Xanthobacteraceae bacterium]|nr:MFS transporter [Xanthobacteraceae bacterium]
MSEFAAHGAVPWYRALDRTHWKALVASNLGWTFDGFEVFALILTVGVALHQLLDPSQYQFIPAYAGAVIAITVFGWGLGGLLGGVLADYLGRKRSMTLTILAYSLLTGLSAFAWDWVSFAVLRFLVGLAIGSEWATGASITAELWPAKARGKGGAFLQSGYPIGSILASGVWLAIGSSGPGAWRYMYLIGVLPALVVFWIRRNIPESPRWEESNRRRRAAYRLRRQGAALEGENAALVRFTLIDMFAEPAVRLRLVVTFVMSLSVTIGYWGVSTFVPAYVGSVAATAALPAQRYAALVGLIQNLGALAGFASFGFLADAFGRKPTTMLYYLMCLVLTPIVYLWVKDIHLLLAAFALYGFFIQGCFSWTPIWLPELFPTRMRATAAGFIFNAPRLISAIAPLIAGTLIVGLGGYGKAATIIGMFYILGLLAVPFLPETRGQPLPEGDTLALAEKPEGVARLA